MTTNNKYYKAEKMKSNIFLRVITCLLVCGYITTAAALPVDEQKARDFAYNQGQELLNAFKEKDLSVRYAAIDQLVKQYVDIDYIAKFVIGKYWRVMTPEQQKQYRDIFERYGLAYYKTLPLDFAADIKYEILSVESDKNFTSVSANVLYNVNGQPQKITLVFRLHQTAQGIKAVDVKVVESSLLLTYRSKFYKMIADVDEELDWFLEDFEDITRTLENSLLGDNQNQLQKSLEIRSKNL